MKTKENYQPEDIEALLAEKAFSELYEEEKAFVLVHLSSAAEYERMREMLLAIRGGAGGEEPATFGPSDRVKRELLAEFAQEQRRRRALWWNSVGLWFRDRLRLDQPAVRLAYAAVVLALVVWLGFRLVNQTPQPELAKNTPAVPGTIAPVPQPSNNNSPAVPVQPEEKSLANAPGEKDAPEDEVVDVQRVAPPQVVVDNTPKPDPAPAMNNVVEPQHVVIANTDPLVDNVPPDSQDVRYVYRITPGSFALPSNAAFNNNNANYLFSGASSNMNSGLTGGTSNAVVTVDSVSASAICNGSATALTATGGTSATYTWSPAASSTNLVGPTIMGNYTVAVYDATCTGTGTITPAVPKSRSLAASAQLIPLFYELK